MFYLYYLLYQIKDTDLLWIVSVDEDYYKLQNNVSDVDNYCESYFIAEREFKKYNLIYEELERVPFRIFKETINDNIIYYT